MSAISLLICDDSALARKQLLQVLPAGWPVDVMPGWAVSVVMMLSLQPARLRA